MRMSKEVLDLARKGDWGVGILHMHTTSPHDCTITIKCFETPQVAEGTSNRSFPVLLVHGSADTIAYSSGSTQLHAALATTGGETKLVVYDGLYHEVLNETPNERAKAQTDIYTFIETSLVGASYVPPDVPASNPV